jgi:thiamine monophosphate kinase
VVLAQSSLGIANSCIDISDGLEQDFGEFNIQVFFNGFDTINIRIWHSETKLIIIATG